MCHGKRYAVYPAGCLYLIGLPLAILHQVSSPMEFECTDCGKRFGRRSPLARFAWVMLIAIFALIIGIILKFLLDLTS